jgi:hypothetical protein
MIRDLTEAMQFGFLRIEERFNARFDRMDMEFAELKQDNKNIHRSLAKIDLLHEDESDHILNHEERITGLEKWKKGFAGA